MHEYPLLYRKIKERGHAIGNHTYSHLKGVDVRSQDYVKDVSKCNDILHAKLFRPPFGSLKIMELFLLKKHYDIIKWSVDMQDYVKLEDVQTHVDKITKQISGGDIVLFHFSEEHSLNTLQLLPLFLSRLENKGFKQVGTWSFESARKLINRIAASGWRVPNGIDPATYKEGD